jgi:crossover junction endodeoxyribonuclease RuvC
VREKTSADALADIGAGLRKLLLAFRPAAMGIEKIYFSKNQKTALRVAEARGALLMVARQEGVGIVEFDPNELKLGITGHGGADKRAVQKMVRLILREPGLHVVDDASDALALAILTARTRGYREK